MIRWVSNARRPSSDRVLAWIGIAFGLIAFWVALPPLKVRTEWIPPVIGLFGITCGINVLIRGNARRLAWFAIVISVLGIGLGYLATRSSEGHLDQVIVWSALTAAMLRQATPLAFAAMGGIFSERSGVVNIGLEGMMLSGAFFGILGADKFNSWQLGLLCAAVSGAAFALIHAFFAIQLRADQIVGGTAINFLALGITGYLFVDIYGGEGTPPDIPGIPNVHLSFLEDWTFIGPVLGNLNLMIWLAFFTIVATWIVLFKTPVGLRLRAVGEHPRAADTVGISVYKTRYAAVILSGILAALGGAYLSIGFVNSFNQNMTVGKGLHRARGGHLRQLASVGRGGCGAPLRLLDRPRAAPARLLGVGGGALPGAAVRAHADRGRRRHRPLDSAGGRWPSLQETVSSNGGPPRPGSARASVLVGLLSVATMPVAILATRWSEQYELMQAGFAIPVGAALGLLAVALARRARSRLAPTLGHPKGRGRPGSAASSACSGSCSPSPRPDRSPSTGSSPSSRPDPERALGAG